jgi:hypothetical protein
MNILAEPTRSRRSRTETSPPGDPVARLLAPLQDLLLESSRLYAAPLPRFESANTFHTLPRYLFVGPGAGSTFIRVGVFAGIHGDEIAGSLAAVELLRRLHQNPEPARGFELFVYPVCNPTGYEDRTRHSRSGKDLNREFWRRSREPEVRLLESEIRNLRFQGIVSLHADDTSDGLYGFARGATLTRDVLSPALAAAEAHLPRNHDAVIDGFAAAHGIIDTGYTGILGAPPAVRNKPFEIVFETPQRAPVRAQVDAHVAAVLTMLETYRSFISYGADL